MKANLSILDSDIENVIIDAINNRKEITVNGISSSLVKRIAEKLGAVSVRSGSQQRGAGAVFANGMKLDSFTSQVVVSSK